MVSKKALFALMILPGLALAAEEPKSLDVAVLPLQRLEGVSSVEMSGIDAMLRAEAENIPRLNLEPPHRRDKKDAHICGTDPACLSRVAKDRAVSLIAAGSVEPHPEGFHVHLVVVKKGGNKWLREVSASLTGNQESQQQALFNLLRRAFIPDDLRGALLIQGGVPGARVLLNGSNQGKLPLDGPLERIPEGKHELVIKNKGYLKWSRTITIQDGETTTVKVRLAKRMADDAAREDAEEKSAQTLAWALPMGLGGGALAVAALGVAAGAYSFALSAEVEKRAAQGLLILPDDGQLLEDGSLYALLANVAYGSALVLGGAAATSYFLLAEDASEEDL
jgi:hypothetical protein